MKNIILILAFFAFISCKKEEIKPSEGFMAIEVSAFSENTQQDTFYLSIEGKNLNFNDQVIVTTIPHKSNTIYKKEFYCKINEPFNFKITHTNKMVSSTISAYTNLLRKEFLIVTKDVYIVTLIDDEKRDVIVE
jgi:hypothetical protein